MSEQEKKGVLEVPAAREDSEIETEHTYEMSCAAPEGLGYGEGTISALNRQTSERWPLTKEQLNKAVEILLENKDRVIVPVEENDDGCGDGRPTLEIAQVDAETGEVLKYKVSKKRAKIFGGGLQVAGSMWRAIAGEALDGETVLGDRAFLAHELKQRGIQYGAHTDEHANAPNCGCGAIDKYALTTTQTDKDKFRDQIVATLGVFFEKPLEHVGVLRALETRGIIAKDSQYMSNASGARTMDLIEQDEAVVKKLGGEHLEAIVVMNDQDGNTVDQEAAADLFEDAGLPDGIQVFVVDIWRGRMYASAVADIAAKRGYDRDEAEATALADFFINQLSVAATLTDGTLPVLVNQ